jgi:hypothetical protein
MPEIFEDCATDRCASSAEARTALAARAGSGVCDHVVCRLIVASRWSSSLARWARCCCVQVSS